MCTFVIWKLLNENNASYSLIFINCVYAAQVVKQQSDGQTGALEQSGLPVYVVLVSVSLTASYRQHSWPPKAFILPLYASQAILLSWHVLFPVPQVSLQLFFALPMSQIHLFLNMSCWY